MTPTPPPAHTAIWNGRAHFDRCVRMHDGRVIVPLPSADAFWIVYESDAVATLAHQATGEKLLTIDANDAKYNGPICYGIAFPKKDA